VYRFGSRTDVPSCARSRRHNDNRVPAGRFAAAGTARVRHRLCRARALSWRGKEPPYFLLLLLLYPLTSLHGRGLHRWWRHRVTWHRVTPAPTQCAAWHPAWQHNVTTTIVNWCSRPYIITTIIIIFIIISSSFLHKFTAAQQTKCQTTVPRYRQIVQAISEVIANATEIATFSLISYMKCVSK